MSNLFWKYIIRETQLNFRLRFKDFVYIFISHTQVIPRTVLFAAMIKELTNKNPKILEIIFTPSTGAYELSVKDENNRERKSCIDTMCDRN